MKKLGLLFLLTQLIFSCQQKELQVGTVAIIPQPAEQQMGEGHFVLDKNTVVSVENDSQASVAQLFFEQFETVSGMAARNRDGRSR